MPTFNSSSQAKLATAHPKLQEIFNEVIKYWDCTILTGHRGEKDQDIAVSTGRSKTPWPTSKHNSLPSMAVDVIPFPIDWSDTNRILTFSGFVLGIAASKGIKLRWGGDWDSDTDQKDQKFYDRVHFELKE